MRSALPSIVILLALSCSTAGAVCDRADFAVAIDPGHTRADPGATSARGVAERVFNEALSARVVGSLRRAGFARTFLTQADPDDASALTERARSAAAGQARLLVSIHHDSAQPQLLSAWSHRGVERRYTDRIRGHSMFVSTRNADPAESLRFARLLGAQLQAQCLTPTLHHAEPIAGEARELIDRRLGIYRYDDLAVLRSAAMPAVLFEAGVIVSRQEELRLRSAAHQRRLAAALTQAVVGFCEGAVPKPLAASPCR